MKNIEADSANKLAGLQCDLLGKFRKGSVTLEQLEWFNLLPRELREALSIFDNNTLSNAIAQTFSCKFRTARDLGVITVPSNYRHHTRLSDFFRRNRSRFKYVKDMFQEVTPSVVLLPGERFLVTAYGGVLGSVQPRECLAFLMLTGGVGVGAEGASLVLEQLGSELAYGGSYLTFDELDRLPIFALEERRVSSIGKAQIATERNLGWIFGFSPYHQGVREGEFLLCFRRYRPSKREKH